MGPYVRAGQWRSDDDGGFGGGRETRRRVGSGESPPPTFDPPETPRLLVDPTFRVTSTTVKNISDEDWVLRRVMGVSPPPQVSPWLLPGPLETVYSFYPTLSDGGCRRGSRTDRRSTQTGDVVSRGPF